jgi:hypothetical protein
MVLGQLHVVFRPGRLISGGDPAIDPICPFQRLTALRDLLGRQEIGNLQQHVFLLRDC